MKPAWSGYLADPAVIRTASAYFAYGTDGPRRPVFSDTSRLFPVLRSLDLKDWQLVGSALEPFDRSLHYWAPDVADRGGRFYMYYSAGGAEGEGHQIRVATSSTPRGPFQDAGTVLLPGEPFSIDGCPFRDPATGQWWLFFAKDYFDGEHPGTGVAVVALSDDMVSTRGEIVTVARPCAPWQLFEKERFWYGRTWPAWYTVEGPFCVYRDGRYWLFVSGGLWKGTDYGVDVLVGSAPEGPYVRAYETDGPNLLPPQEGLRGPGHNSVVVGPDGRHWICFHAWNEAYTMRQMYVEPLGWGGNGPFIQAR